MSTWYRKLALQYFLAFDGFDGWVSLSKWPSSVQSNACRAIQLLAGFFSRGIANDGLVDGTVIKPALGRQHPCMCSA